MICFDYALTTPFLAKNYLEHPECIPFVWRLRTGNMKEHIHCIGLTVLVWYDVQCTVHYILGGLDIIQGNFVWFMVETMLQTLHFILITGQQGVPP